ncbi:MAG: hypothetical protein QOH36_997 [Actinomycetota bacterium]|nr:hypothetical protein [Actinomycetota bacterium]
MSEELAGLEEQRDVLLKSLRDLEQERASGEIGDDDYTVLKDDYTARAAAVLKAIETGRSAVVRRPRGRAAGGRPRQPPAVRAAASRSAANPAAGTSRAGSRRARPSADGRAAATAAEDLAAATGADADTRPVGDRPAAATGAIDTPADTRPVGDRPPAATGAIDTTADTRPVGDRPPGATGDNTTEAATRPVGKSRAAAGATDKGSGTRPGGSRQAAARRRANPPVPRRQRTVAVSLIVVFAIVAVAGVSVVLFSDGRTGDEPITGSVPDAPTADSRVDDALALETEGKAVEALQLYDEILVSDPDNVEALAYRGWLLKRAGLPDEAMASLDRAVTVDPAFADAHFFRGMVLYQDRDDPAGAVIEFQAFLANNPPPDFVDAVGEVLAQAQAAAAAKATAPTATTAVP